VLETATLSVEEAVRVTVLETVALLAGETQAIEGGVMSGGEPLNAAIMAAYGSLDEKVNVAAVEPAELCVLSSLPIRTKFPDTVPL
jgi:hypothetical protein